MKHPSSLRMVALHGLALVALGGAAAFGLVSCENRDSIGADKPVSAPPTGPHLDLTVEASKDTHYQILCDVRTYQTPEGAYANRYGVDKAGPFKDYILSPSAHCTTKIVSGPGPVKLTLAKPGSIQSQTITTPGDAGKNTLHVW